MNAIDVLLVDDEASIRASLRALLENEPDINVVGEACDGDEAVEQALRLRPDVILMDVQMPKMTGLDATRLLCARSNGPRIIMLTMFDLDEYVYEALRAGASGYLLKSSSPVRVTNAIRAPGDAGSLFAPEVTQRLIDRLAPVRPDGRLRSLTAREHETLTLIGHGMSNAEISACLFVTPTTARTYVSRLLTKLGARDRVQLVIIAYESGLIQRGSTRPLS